MEESEGLAYWKEWIDGSVEKASRWHSTQRGEVRTSDSLGDHLMAELWKVGCVGESGEAASICADELMQQLKSYEREPRLLAKLAGTGFAVQAVERTIATVLETLDLRDPEVLGRWRQQLRDERDQRLKLYEALLGDEDRLRAEVGEECQQVEVQTLLMHGLEKYDGVLTTRERDVMSSAFDAAVRLSAMIVVTVPVWFATTERGWYDAVASHTDGGEEACLREVSVWAALHHPNVRKFYGACHVGEQPTVIHEQVMPVDCPRLNWRILLGCARGVHYVHEQGLVYKHLTASQLVVIPNNTGALSGLGLTRSNVTGDSVRGGFGEAKNTNVSKETTVDAFQPSIPGNVLALGPQSSNFFESIGQRLQIAIFKQTSARDRCQRSNLAS